MAWTRVRDSLWFVPSVAVVIGSVLVLLAVRFEADEVPPTLRALSPGINDPTTAMRCIDRLTEILAALGTREMPPAARRNPKGTLRVLMQSTTFPHAVSIAFDQIRFFGAENPA